MTVAFALMLTAVSCGNDSVEVKGSTVTTTITNNTVVITTPPSTTTTTTNPPIDFNRVIAQAREVYGKCGEWHDLALSVGWQESEWKTLSYVLHRESRCQPSAWNGHDAGLTQINQIHTKWLNQMGLNHPDSMFDPALNLTFAYRLYSGREENNQCGWTPWSIKCK
jgi:hypothetical protein